MELQLKKETAKRLFPESPRWFQDVLNETFGDECFKKRHFTDIESYEDACEVELPSKEDAIYDTDSPYIINLKKLVHIIKVVRGDFDPDYANRNQKKWHPIFDASSGSGLVFSDSHCNYVYASASLGSRFCFPNQEQSDYVAKKFIKYYEVLILSKK